MCACANRKRLYSEQYQITTVWEKTVLFSSPPNYTMQLYGHITLYLTRVIRTHHVS